MAEKAGVVGLGRMGLAMSANLIQSGFTVKGFDACGDQMKKFEEGGGTLSSSPAGAAGDARFVVLSLPSSETVREVCLGAGGICEGAEEGLLVIDTTTARPEDSAEIAGALELRGIGFLDASLSGSSKSAWKRDLVAMVGGSEPDFERARPLLNAIARSSYYLGPSGAGARTKLIVNLVLGLNRLALAEGLVLGMKADMNLETLLAVLKDGAAYSREMDSCGEKMIRADYAPEIALLRIHHKDVRLMLEQGRRYSAPMWLTSLMEQFLQAAESGGLSEADSSAVIEVSRTFAGIPARQPLAAT